MKQLEIYKSFEKSPFKSIKVKSYFDVYEKLFLNFRNKPIIFIDNQNRVSLFNLASSEILGLNEKAVSNMFIRKFSGASHEKILGKSDSRDGTSNFLAEYIQSIITLTMDEFCNFSAIVPTDIKIDVDGIEHLILEGGSKYLKNNKLKSLSVEINENFRDQYEKVLKIIHENIISSSGKRIKSDLDKNLL